LVTKSGVLSSGTRGVLLSEYSPQRATKRANRKLHPEMLEKLIHSSFNKNISPRAILQIMLSPLKNDFPWIYDNGINLLDKTKNGKSSKDVREFRELLEFTFENPLFRNNLSSEYDYSYYRELSYLIERVLELNEYRNNDISQIENN